MTHAPQYPTDLLQQKIGIIENAVANHRTQIETSGTNPTGETWDAYHIANQILWNTVLHH